MTTSPVFSRQTTAAHVLEAVFMHGFIDADDWSRGLGELARMSDADIDAMVADARKGKK